jgi:hypothetical protein
LCYHGSIGIFFFFLSLCVPWPCCFSESQSPANCAIHASFLSLHRQGGLFGTSWESECHTRLQCHARVNSAAALATAGACLGLCLIRIKEQAVTHQVELHLLDSLLLDKTSLCSLW